MFKRKLRWLKCGSTMVNLDHAISFDENDRDKNIVYAVLDGVDVPLVLDGVTLDEIYYFLKHGKLKKRA